MDIVRSLLVISVNDGRISGSGDQQCSISFLHSGSQRSGTGGRSVFFTIPPSLASDANQTIKFLVKEKKKKTVPTIFDLNANRKNGNII